MKHKGNVNNTGNVINTSMLKTKAHFNICFSYDGIFVTYLLVNDGIFLTFLLSYDGIFVTFLLANDGIF